MSQSRILVVEDENLILKALVYRLKKDGHNITSAMDGREALTMLQENEFDLVLTDIMLPYNSGMEIVNYVKSNYKKRVPVIVLSSLGLEEVVLEAFRLGADDFITKPFSPSELSVRVLRLLKESAESNA